MASSFTETFDSEKGAPGLGSFSIEFRPGTADQVLGPLVDRTSEVAGGAMENFKRDLICITSTDLGDDVSRDEVVGASIWQGVAVEFGLPVGIEAAQSQGWSIGGSSPLLRLGNAESPGVGYPVSPGASMAGMAMWEVFAYLDPLTTGSIGGFPYTYSGLSTNDLGVEASELSSTRDVFNLAIQNTEVKTEYRFDPTSGLIFAASGSSSAFRQTPQVIFTSSPTVTRDGDLWAFQVSGRVVYDYASEADHAYSGVTTEVFIDRLGYPYDGVSASDGVMGVRFNEADIASTADLANLLTSTYCRKERMTLTVDAYSLKNYINAGDYAWVNCPEASLVDTQENINFAGEETHPIKLRVASLTCPVRPTHGVYVIHNATRYGGTNAVARLNDYVDWSGADAATTSVTFGSIPTTRKLVYGSAWRKR